MDVIDIHDAGETYDSGAVITTIMSDEIHFKGYADNGFVYLEATPNTEYKARIVTSGIVSVMCIGDVAKGDMVYSIPTGETNAGKVTATISNNQLGIALSDSSNGLVVIMLAPAYVAGGSAASIAWSNVTGKPSTFPPETHTHANYLEDAPSDDKKYGRKNGSWVEVSGGGSVAWDDVTDKPSTFPPSTHTHNEYLTDAPSDTKKYGRKDGAWVEITGGSGGSVAWSDVTGKPSTFPPATHNHNIINSVVRTTETNLQSYDVIPSKKCVALNVSEYTYDAMHSGIVFLNLPTNNYNATNCPLGVDIYVDADLDYSHVVSPIPNHHESSVVDEFIQPQKIGYSTSEPMTVNNRFGIYVNLDWGEEDKSLYFSKTGEWLDDEEEMSRGMHRLDYPAILIEAPNGTNPEYYGCIDYHSRCVWVLGTRKGYHTTTGNRTLYKQMSGIVAVRCTATANVAVGETLMCFTEQMLPTVTKVTGEGNKRCGYSLSSYLTSETGKWVWMLIDFAD